ncbi:MAG TPA: twin-arginine translocase TatA/TatE family subunit [Polyangia bacterium]
MLGLGMGELLLILAIALLVFGPSKLPQLASGLGKAVRSFKKATSGADDEPKLDPPA